METKSIDLIWIVVKNLKQAVKFYTETMGFVLKEMHEEFAWAELQGHHGGARLGIAQMGMDESLSPGSNAVVTLTVANIEKTLEELKKKSVRFLGSLQEVPGHVKMQSVIDEDGNHLQVVQILH